jgi:hypothetical protein
MHEEAEIVREPRDLSEEIEPSFLGDMNILCPHCSALFFHVERNTAGKFTRCCQKGKVYLRAKPAVPELVIELLDGTHQLSGHFKKNIIYYNNSFAMCSLGIGRMDIATGGPYIVKMNGLIMHRTSWIHPNGNDVRSYAQIYVLDPERAVETRQQQIDDLREDLLLEMELELRRCNPYVRTFAFLKELVQNELVSLYRIKVAEEFSCKLYKTPH